MYIWFAACSLPSAPTCPCESAAIGKPFPRIRSTASAAAPGSTGISLSDSYPSRSSAVLSVRQPQNDGLNTSSLSFCNICARRSEFLSLPLLPDTILRLVFQVLCGFAPTFYVGSFNNYYKGVSFYSKLILNQPDLTFMKHCIQSDRQTDRQDKSTYFYISIRRCRQ